MTVKIYFIGDYNFWNLFICQPKNNRLEIKDASSGLRYVNDWLSKRLHDISKLFLVTGAQAPIVRNFEYNVKLEFNVSALAVQ